MKPSDKKMAKNISKVDSLVNKVFYNFYFCIFTSPKHIKTIIEI